VGSGSRGVGCPPKEDRISFDREPSQRSACTLPRLNVSIFRRRSASAPARPIGHLPDRIRFIVGAVAAVGLVIAAYSNSFRNAFHFDDAHVIEENLFIRDLNNVPRFFVDAGMFSSLPQNATYRPIVSVSLAFDYWWGGGLNPVAFHVTQLILLLLVGVALAALYQRLLRDAGMGPEARWIALAAATFFCLHTANTQAANYISARSELLSGLGVVGGLLLYIGSARARRYHLYLLPVAFGALAKTPAVMFAPLLLAYRVVYSSGRAGERGRAGMFARLREVVLPTLPAFAASIALYLFVEGMNPPGQTYGGGGRMEYLWTQAWVWVRYVGLFLVPAGLTADTDLTLLPTWVDGRVAAGVALLGGSLAVAWRTGRSLSSAPLAFGILWFWIALAPSSSVFPLAEVTNDHRVFFPYMGLVVAAAWVVVDGARRLAAWGGGAARIVPPLTTAAVLLLLLVHARETYRRNLVWLDAETLWADVVVKSPRNGRGLMNYGLTQMEQGRLDVARDLFLQAQALTPNYPVLEVNLGIVNAAIGDADAAEHHFRRALSLSPDYAGAHLYYARWLAPEGRASEAIPLLERAVDLSPGNVDARHLLMRLLAARGDGEGMRTLAAETLRLSANDPVALAALGRSAQADASSAFEVGRRRMRAGDPIEAAVAFREAVGLAPADADAWNDLGWSLGQLGFYAEAIVAFDTALRAGHDFELARNNLVWATERLAETEFLHAFRLQEGGDYVAALAIYLELTGRYPQWANALYNAGLALESLDRCEEAVAMLERALEADASLVAAHLHLAECHQRLGNAPAATRHRDAFAGSGGNAGADPRSGGL